MTNHTARIADLIKSLQDRRYPTLLIGQNNNTLITLDQARSLAELCALRFINYREEVLVPKDSPVILGAYIRGQFREWLREQAQMSRGVFVMNVDELLSTWPDPERRAFFIDFLHIESNCLNEVTVRAPIVLLSRHAASFNVQLKERGQGIFFSPSRDE